MKKKIFCSIVVFFTISAFVFVYEKSFAQKVNKSNDYYLLIGTYSPADSNSIYVYKFNTETGSASFVNAISGIENPSYLTISPDHSNVYAVSETGGPYGGGIYSYAFNSSSGKLQLLNHEPSGGSGPCYVTMDKKGHWVFVANYGSGSFSVFPVNKNGVLGKAVQTIQDQGHSVNKRRQDHAHVHCIIVAPNNRDVFVSDLGMDEVLSYQLNEKTGILSKGEPPIKVMPGRGPRHFVFHLNGKFLYLIQEMAGSITAFSYEPGKLTPIQTISTIPKGFKGIISGGAIHFSPDGKYLYASNRDDLNNIVIFSVNPKSGKLEYVGKQYAGGRTPRDFAITPDGKYLLVGHQNSSEISIFKRNRHSGKIRPTEGHITVRHAVCLKMFPVVNS